MELMYTQGWGISWHPECAASDPSGLDEKPLTEGGAATELLVDAAIMVRSGAQLCLLLVGSHWLPVPSLTHFTPRLHIDC